MEFKTTSHKRSKNRLLLIAGLVLLLLFAAIAGFFFWKWQSLRSNADVVAEATSARVVQKIGKFYDLPKDEKPTVAQIQDKNKLKDQSFFNKAQNGDYLVMYTNAKLALLYREKDNKLINVGPITIQDNKQNSEEEQPTESSSQPSPNSPNQEQPPAQP